MPNLTTSSAVDTFMGSVSNAAALANLGAVPLTGGTLTGALTAPNIRVTSLTTSLAPAFGFTDAAATGWYSPNNGTAYFGGASRGITLGLNRASLGAITIGYSSRIDFCSGAADVGTLDLFVGRSAAATLQLGVNAASTATAQTIKSHDVTTGTGANLILSGGTGSVANGVVIISRLPTSNPGPGILWNNAGTPAIGT